MGRAEERLFPPGECLFCADQIDRPLGSAFNLIGRQWSHGTSLRVIFLLVGLLGLAGAALSAMTLR